eukprot:TRINITY_DN1092_c0_g1_i2.p1 TRINITY_DN1092_c0_g1~~TRINITY_DN1092_c0_g1_i2.p1  ORF type:complete len:181 (+),score=18.64 TRINITY_DN1092_c0_g1_i2:58-600(+)
MEVGLEDGVALAVDIDGDVVGGESVGSGHLGLLGSKGRLGEDVNGLDSLDGLGLLLGLDSQILEFLFLKVGEDGQLLVEDAGENNGSDPQHEIQGKDQKEANFNNVELSWGQEIISSPPFFNFFFVLIVKYKSQNSRDHSQRQDQRLEDGIKLQQPSIPLTGRPEKNINKLFFRFFFSFL